MFYLNKFINLNMEISQKAIERWASNDILDYAASAEKFPEFSKHELICMHYVCIL